jgi:N utilization substance protein B
VLTLLDFKSFAPSDVRMIRRSAVQFLYQFDRLALVSFRSEMFHDFCQQSELPEHVQQVTADWIQCAVEHLDEHDRWIQGQSQNWSLDRMARVDLAILRVCLAELRFRDGVKPAIVMADAAEIAKEFGAEGSAAFVHGILDGVYKKWLQNAPSTGQDGPS